ncbi:phosphoadenosine phosphosulfate reductase [Thioclava sp. SK-1]|nr:phosphoadenylyl-sulfate reductase [Thioclava sp. SK-1]OCX67202.1 phosphoadenosine phosphosulfate reductase [Thioclava sp. SK-1]
MPRDILPDINSRVQSLNDRYKHHAAIAVMEKALADADTGEVALVSSFGAESVVLLHMVSLIAPSTPVLFIDTLMLFQETLDYQTEVAQKLGLTDVRTIVADDAALALEDPDNTLHQFNTDACCNLRKTVPLENALSQFDAWITGRKRYQGDTRKTIDFFEVETPERMKINPLAHWAREDLQEYMIENRLPKHPLVAKGYPSIGCAPCTSPVKPGEDPRAGRWRGQAKTECGIHFIGGKMVRVGPDGKPIDDGKSAGNEKEKVA